MDAVLEMFNRAIDQLLSRSSGPLHFRLILQPIVAGFLAIRAGIRDAREGNPAFFWTVLTNKQERAILLKSGWADVGKVFIIAVVIDAIYQVIVLRGFFVLQALIVATAVAVVPYVILRGPVTRIVRTFKRFPGPASLTPAPKQ